MWTELQTNWRELKVSSSIRCRGRIDDSIGVHIDFNGQSRYAALPTQTAFDRRIAGHKIGFINSSIIDHGQVNDRKR